MIRKRVYIQQSKDNGKQARENISWENIWRPYKKIEKKKSEETEIFHLEKRKMSGIVTLFSALLCFSVLVVCFFGE